jgi:hypothetical protein
VLAVDIIKNFCITAKSFWCFLKNIVKLTNKIEALRRVALSIGNSSAYRLWKSFLNSQSRMRSLLTRLSPAPEVPTTCCPAVQTIAHLESAFRNDSLLTSPIAAFQAHFQIPFL